MYDFVFKEKVLVSYNIVLYVISIHDYYFFALGGLQLRALAV